MPGTMVHGFPYQAIGAQRNVRDDGLHAVPDRAFVCMYTDDLNRCTLERLTPACVWYNNSESE